MKDPRRVAAGVRAKTKGNAFERRIAKMLKEWWGLYNPDADFQRTPLSGGSRLKEGWMLVGDIVCNDPTYPFHTELKNRERWRIDQIFEDTGPVISEWWAQTVVECPVEKEPLLILTRNHRPAYCVFRNARGRVSNLAKDGTTFLWCKVAWDDGECEDVLMMLLDDFLLTDPEVWLDS